MRIKNSFSLSVEHYILINQMSLDSYKEEQEYINNIKYNYELIAQERAAVQINSEEFFNKLKFLKKLYNIILQTSYKNAAERLVILILPFRSQAAFDRLKQAMDSLSETYMDALRIIDELKAFLNSYESNSKSRARL